MNYSSGACESVSLTMRDIMARGVCSGDSSGQWAAVGSGQWALGSMTVAV